MGGKVRKVLKSIWGDAVDLSWQEQAIVLEEAKQIALLELQRQQAATLCTTQMLGMQSMMTKKHLLEFQMQEHLHDALYSDICADGDGSLPFCGDLLQMAEGSVMVLAEDKALSAVSKYLGTDGANFFQEHLRGVPNVEESRSSGASVPSVVSPKPLAKTPKTVSVRGARKKVNTATEQKRTREASCVGSWSQTLVATDNTTFEVTLTAEQPVAPKK